MGLFKRKNKEVQTTPQINLPGIKLPTLQYDDAAAKAKLDKLNMDSLETAQNKTMRYQTRATQDVSLEDMATRLGIDSNQLLEWNQGADQGFKQGDIINLNLTNDQGRALMKSVDELRAENERRAAERQEYANRDDVKQYGFMRGLTGKQVMNTFRTQKDFDNENARVKHNTAIESDIIANDQRQAVRNRRDWGPMQFDDGTSELTSKQFVGDIQDAMNTAGEYGLKFAGAVGGAMALPALGQGLIQQVPGMIRDYFIYDKIVNPTVTTITDRYMNDGLAKDIVNSAASFAGTNLLSGLYRTGKRALLTEASNYLDQNAGIWGSQVADKLGLYATKASNALRNYVNYNNITSGNPEVVANTIKGVGIGTGLTLTDKGLDAIGVDNPLAKEAIKFGAMALTPMSSGWFGKRLSRNSGGAQTGDQALSNLVNPKKTKYDLDDPLYATASNGNKVGTGNFARMRGIEGESPMKTWSTNIEGATYKSPYWDKVNPDAKFANEAYEFFYRPSSTIGDAYRARRPFGSSVEIKSAQSLPEFQTQARNLTSDKGRTLMQDITEGNTLNLHHVNSDIKIANAPGIGVNQGIFRNEKGHIESGLYTDQFGNKVVSRSDYGGTGSGGNEGFRWNRGNNFFTNLLRFGKNKGAQVMKHHIDIDSQRTMPITINNATTKTVSHNSKNRLGISTDNNTAYHITPEGKLYLPIFNGQIGEFSLFHKRGGKIGINQIGI